MSLGLHNNMMLSCQVVLIDGIGCNSIAELSILEHYNSKIVINNVTWECFNQIKDKDSIIIVLKKDEEYITVVTSYLSDSSFRYCEDTDIETGITLTYASSVILDGYYPEKDGAVEFDSFTCRVTEDIELLGIYPYTIEKQEKFPEVDMHVMGQMKFQNIGRGFSCFVVPQVTKNITGMNLSMYSRIQYSSKNKKSLSEIKQLLIEICLFFEILAGETVTITEAKLENGEKSYEYIGCCNFPKYKLSNLKNGFDTRSYLRKGLFKVSDFGAGIEKALDKFLELMKDNKLAYEAYRQVLLDEEVKIVTYNKFLKIMQMIEGYQRGKKEAEEQKKFEECKQIILDKLEDANDKEFINKYTKYDGQTFRKCLNDFTCKSLGIVSGLSKTSAEKCSKEIVSNIFQARNVYTHASKESKPLLLSNELDMINYCYKTFFRILTLNEMGLGVQIIRSRLAHDRRFVSYYEAIFNLNIKESQLDEEKGRFDDYMWGYDD